MIMWGYKMDDSCNIKNNIAWNMAHIAYENGFGAYYNAIKENYLIITVSGWRKSENNYAMYTVVKNNDIVLYYINGIQVSEIIFMDVEKNKQVDQIMVYEKEIPIICLLDKKR